mmetsp:Transcript_9208/g.22279  ORF Transcript_9208/g.22279 Transcript_9208/m.22279 type:complete len:168 (-) Transcript_9208:1035-1538(-)
MSPYITDRRRITICVVPVVAPTAAAARCRRPAPRPAAGIITARNDATAIGEHMCTVKHQWHRGVHSVGCHCSLTSCVSAEMTHERAADLVMLPQPPTRPDRHRAKVCNRVGAVLRHARCPQAIHIRHAVDPCQSREHTAVTPHILRTSARAQVPNLSVKHGREQPRS